VGAAGVRKSTNVYVALASIVAAVAAITIVLTIANMSESTLGILNKDIEPAVRQWDNKSLIVTQVEYIDYWKGNSTVEESALMHIGSYSFDYTANESGMYEIYFFNAWENQDPVSISLEYSAPQRDMKAQSLSIPYGSQTYFREMIESGESIGGNFNVTGHPNQGILFTLLLPKCTQSIPFSFTLANTGQANDTANVQFRVDGKPVWSNNYVVEASRLRPEGGTVIIEDCIEHTFNLDLA